MNSIFTSKEIQTKAYIIGGLTFFLIAVQVINMLTGQSLVAYGIEPRDLTGLGGIIFSPFIHGSFQHLVGLLCGILAAWVWKKIG